MNQPSSDPCAFNPGDILNQTWRLDHHVASGGLAEVWKATHVRTGDTVAFKILLASGCGLPNFELRMAREVELLNRLRHPNVVQYKGHDLLAGRVSACGERLPCRKGCPFVILEWVDGESLSALMRRRRKGAFGAILSFEEVRRWFCEIIGALEQAHQLGILHRDITPSNLFIRIDGSAVVIDWNLAVSRTSRDITVLNNPEGAGTPYYAAPEQRQSLASANETADVYSLAVVLIRALTDVPLKFLCERDGGRTVSPLRARAALQHRKSGRLFPVPRQLVTLLVAALDPNPSLRPSQVRDFLPALEDAAAEDGTLAMEPTPPSSRSSRPSLPLPPTRPRPVAATVRPVWSPSLAETAALSTGRSRTAFGGILETVANHRDLSWALAVAIALGATAAALVIRLA